MPNSVLAIEGEGDMKYTSSSTIRPRMKKKSSLTKLKERRQKEADSSANSRQENNVDVTRSPENVQKPSEYAVELLNVEKQMEHIYSSVSSTKHSSEEPNKPRPKPRGRRQSSDIVPENSSATKGSENVEHTGNDSSDGTTVQIFKSLKMDNDQEATLESAVSQSSFLPRPPSTPRTSRSNPRTPKGFVVAGKGERKIIELCGEKGIREPCSSGDEHELEVEEKKEKSNKINHGLVSDTMPVLDSLSTVDTVYVSREKSVSSSDIESKNSEKLKQRLKCTGGDLSGREVIHEQECPEFDSTYLNYSLTHFDTHYMNSNNNGNTETDISVMKEDGCSVDESPEDKALESASRPMSRKSNRHLGQISASSVSDFGITVDKNSPYSSPSHFSGQTNGHAGFDHDNRENNSLVLSDHWAHPPNDNSSTQLLHTSSPLKLHSVQSPPKTIRLSPISPRSRPPPLPDQFSSRSLRTMYKIDPEINSVVGTPRFKSYMDKSDLGSHSNGDLVSQKSFASTSVLPVITVQEARSRNNLEGSVIIGSPSVLGADELDRYFPDRKVNVFVGTWNMNELKDVASSIDDFILPIKCDFVQDIYAIGTQENTMNKKEWEIKIQETLGSSHVMYHSVSIGSLHLAVYIRRDLIWFCTVPEDDVISLRAVAVVKTKGAIGICFTLFGTSYLFINCHLTSDRDNDTSRKKIRLGDYHKVLTEMKLPKLPENSTTSEKPGTNSKTDITAVFDCIFWFGDLNFRIERQRHAVEKKVNQITSEEIPNFETLLGGDQLIKYIAEGKIFGGFQEGRINFHPTFKFDVGTETYDSSVKNRVPSYTDRIMFRCKRKNDITCIQYDAVMSVKLSDHRPVYGQYETTIRPARDSMVYSLGHFDRSVYVEGNRRRAATRPMKRKQSAVCTVQ